MNIVLMTDHQNYAYKVLTEPVETGLRYNEKAFSHAQKKERQNQSLQFIIVFLKLFIYYPVQYE